MKKAFLERNQWIIFRSVIQDDILDRCDGVLLASKPATKKGTTGWAKFPGMQRTKLPAIKQPFLTCLQNNSSPHQHTTGEHDGHCLKLIDASSKCTQKQICEEVSRILKHNEVDLQNSLFAFH